MLTHFARGYIFLICKVTFLLWLMQTFCKKKCEKIEFSDFMLYSIFLTFGIFDSYYI